MDLVVEEGYNGDIPAGHRAIKSIWLDECLEKKERVGVSTDHLFYADSDDESSLSGRPAESQRRNGRKSGEKATSAKSTATAKATRAKRSTKAAEEPESDDEASTAHGATQTGSRRGRGAKAAAKATETVAEAVSDEEVDGNEVMEVDEAPATQEPESVQQLHADEELGAFGEEVEDEEEEEEEDDHNAPVAGTNPSNIGSRSKSTQAAILPEEPIHRLQYEVFVRYGSKMPVWREDKRPNPLLPNRKPTVRPSTVAGANNNASAVSNSDNQAPIPIPTRGRAGPGRAPFPVQLLSVPRCTLPATEIEVNARYKPEEDAAMLICMIRAFPLFRTTQLGASTYQSPCLWHWAQQHRLINRTWESMKSRARQVLIAVITGEADIQEAVYHILKNNEYFIFEGYRLVSYNRKAVERDNERSRVNENNAELLRALAPAPDAVPVRKGKRGATIAIRPDDVGSDDDQPATAASRAQADVHAMEEPEEEETTFDDENVLDADEVSTAPNKRQKVAEEE